MALSGYVNEHRDDLDPWRLTVLIGLALVPLGLVQLQPDLGTNMVLLVIVVGLLTIAGVKGRYLVILGLLGFTAIYAIVNLGVLKQYQLDRLTLPATTTATTDARRTTRTSRRRPSATVGSPARACSTARRPGSAFVPEQHTDFIFTVVGEELGFVGGATLLALFAIVVWRTWRTARLSPATSSARSSASACSRCSRSRSSRTSA